MLTGVKHFHTHTCELMHTQNSHLSHLESAIDFGSKVLWAMVSMATQWLRRPKFLSLLLVRYPHWRKWEEGEEEEREREASFLFCATGQCWLHSTLAATAFWSLHTKQSSVIQTHTDTNVNLINIPAVLYPASLQLHHSNARTHKRVSSLYEEA